MHPKEDATYTRFYSSANTLKGFPSTSAFSFPSSSFFPFFKKPSPLGFCSCSAQCKCCVHSGARPLAASISQARWRGLCFAHSIVITTGLSGSRNLSSQREHVLGSHCHPNKPGSQARACSHSATLFMYMKGQAPESGRETRSIHPGPGLCPPARFHLQAWSLQMLASFPKRTPQHQACLRTPPSR